MQEYLNNKLCKMSTTAFIFQYLKDFGFFAVLYANSQSLLVYLARRRAEDPQMSLYLLMTTSWIKSVNAPILLVYKLRFRDVE